VQWVCDSLERLPWRIQIHRLTGDALAHLLIAPEWSRDKLGVLDDIQREMHRRGTRQGSAYERLRSVSPPEPFAAQGVGSVGRLRNRP
jgi:hypothetical protein